MFVLVGFVFPGKHYVCWGPGFQEADEHLSACGKQWKIPDFPLLVHAEFTLTSLLTPVFPSYSFPPSCHG